jgi:hypothetical protein
MVKARVKNSSIDGPCSPLEFEKRTVPLEIGVRVQIDPFRVAKRPDCAKILRSTSKISQPIGLRDFFVWGPAVIGEGIRATRRVDQGFFGVLLSRDTHPVLVSSAASWLAHLVEGEHPAVLHSLLEFRLGSHLTGWVEPGPHTDTQPVLVLTH